MEVVTIAQGADPASPGFKAQRAELTREIEQAAVKATGLTADAAVATAKPTSERAFFDELDGLLRARKWSDAELLIRSQRNSLSRPAWFETRDSDLRVADVRIKQGRGDRAAMLASAGLYLNGEAERSRRMAVVAGEIFAAGDRAPAIALVEAILRKTPDFVMA